MSVATPGFAEVLRSRTFPARRLEFKTFMCDPSDCTHRREMRIEQIKDITCCNSSYVSLACQSFSPSLSFFFFFLHLETESNGYLQPCFTQGLSKYLSKMFSTCATGIPLPLDACMLNPMTYEFMTQCIHFPRIKPQF